MSTRSDHDPRTLLGPESYPETTVLPPLEDLEGMEVRDSSGEKVGKVADTYTDSAGIYVRYIAVSTGGLGTKRHMIPIDDVRLESDGKSDCLTLPYDGEQLKSGPRFERDEQITHEHEQGIYGHYGRAGYWDAVRARQTPPAPTPQIAEAEVADAIRRGEDPNGVAVKRWGV